MRMNKYKTLVSIALVALALGGCRQDDLDVPEPQQLVSEGDPVATASPTQSLHSTVPNVIRVSFSPELAQRVEQALQGETLRSTGTSIDKFLEEVDALSLKRVFPYAGKYEKRTRREGLHLWYDITTREEADSKRATEAQRRALALAEAFDGIQVVEPVYVAALPNVQPVPYKPEASWLRNTGEALPTDDPLLPMQWHYHNQGNFIRSVAGADINLYRAWEIERGKNTVIVSVVDGGIDIDHEDLIDNLYTNQDELRGEPGKDDDDNGYVDDIHGFNFTNNKPTITAHDHGTHVAGTVAARSNNGRGVAGVAGGDGSAGSGVRLMSCQTFAKTPSGSNTSGGFEAAIKYGADNGALISQNSWGNPGSTVLPQSTKEAIDYFIKYAGCDNEGKQLPGSLMKGGVVIFAAGNEGYDYRAAMASYAPVVSVTAMAPNFKASYFTTRGDWATVMAPGGDLFYHNGQVLSTLPGSQYGYMQGTSMACPHVSGIAALIVSHYGGAGFTNDELKRRLSTSLLARDINKENPQYVGRLGAGYIDAAKALAPRPTEAELAANTAPETVRWRDIVATHTGLRLEWFVPADAEDEKAFGYRLYATDKSFTEQELEAMDYHKIVEAGASAGEILTRSFTGLKADAEYFFALVPYDKWGKLGKPSFRSARTLSNHAPQIKMPEIAPIRLMGSETYDLLIPVTDADGHSWTYSVIGPTHGVLVEQVADGLKLQFRVRASVGQYKLQLRVTDELGASNELEVPFEIYQNQVPTQSKRFGRIYLPVGSTQELSLTDYFTDPDGEALSYTVRAIGASKSGEATVVDDKLHLRGLALGISAFELVASDAKGAVVKAVLELEVINNELLQLVYPTPTRSTLSVRVAPRAKNITLTVYTPTGIELLRKALQPNAEGMITLDVSSLPAGSYVLQGSANGEIVRKTFIKR